MPLTERRCHPRKEVRGVKTWMLITEGKAEVCSIVDMSRKGVFVASPRLLRPGTIVELAFVKADGAKVTRLIRRCGAVVRYSPKGFAVYFAHPRPRVGALGHRGAQR